MMALTKIISGGQSGVDIAGLRFAKSVGITTGGWAPKNYMTEFGPNYDLREEYNLIEHTGTYKDRTVQNVHDADGTLIFFTKLSQGTILTIKTCQILEKPYIINPKPNELKVWLKKNCITILNIAGNRESISPGIEQRVFRYLNKTFSLPETT